MKSAYSYNKETNEALELKVWLRNYYSGLIFFTATIPLTFLYLYGQQSNSQNQYILVQTNYFVVIITLGLFLISPKKIANSSLRTLFWHSWSCTCISLIGFMMWFDTGGISPFLLYFFLFIILLVRLTIFSVFYFIHF